MCSRRATRVTIVGLAALAVGVLAACSSGSGSSGTSTSASTAAAADDNAGVVQAKADVQQFLKRPTDFGITQPIGKPVPTGKTIDFIYCGVPVCSTYGDAVTRAAKILGWNTEVITTQGTPESVKQAWDTVVRKKPAAVISTGWDTSSYAPELAQLKAMHIPVFNHSTSDPGPTGNVTARTGGVAANSVSGKQLAAWIVSDTNGSADTLYVDLPAYLILAGTKAEFDSSYKQYCPSCKVDHMDMPVTSLGKDAPSRIVTYLRSHPDVNYVAFSQDAASIGLPAALKAAGLSGKVKFAGIAGSTQNLQYVKDGQEAATVNQGYYEEMYALVDSAARSTVGVALNEIFHYPVPFWIDTKATVTNTSAFGPVVPDIDQKAAKLWGK